MRALCLLVCTVALAASVARAECTGPHDIDKILGVAADGRFLYSNETRTELDPSTEPTTFELVIVGADGEPETTITRTKDRDWKLEGKPLPPSVIAGKPSIAVLETRVRAQLGALTPLQPSKREAHVVRGQSGERVVLDKAVVKMLKLDDDRGWRVRVLQHASSPLVFLALSNYPPARSSCKLTIEDIEWIDPKHLDPSDKSVMLTFCDEQRAKEEERFNAPEDETYRADDPWSQWLVCTKDTVGAGYLEWVAARVAKLDGAERRRLLRAVAQSLEGAWTPLQKLTKSRLSEQRVFALLALTSLDAALRTHNVHGEKRDPAARAALLPVLKELCATNPEANAKEAAARAACQSEIAMPSKDVFPEEEPCHPGSCSRTLVGVAPDGRFIVEQIRGKQSFELRAADGQLLLRLTDNCKAKTCDMRWDLDGNASPEILELTTADPKPDKLRAGLMQSLALSPVQTAQQPVTLVGNHVRIGNWIVATVEEERLDLTAFAHAKSMLLFVETAQPSCKDTRCRIVVWGPRPPADATDFAALARECQQQTDLATLAPCLGSIVDERVYPLLIQYARRDDDVRLSQAAARVATALGRKPLIDYTGSTDAFTRQWALYALKQLLEDATERLPFTGSAPDKRRPAFVAEVEPYCKRGLADRDLIVAGGAIACLAQTKTKVDPKRMREVLHSPHLDTRAAVFEIAKRQDVIVGPELRYVGGWLGDPIDKKDPDYQEFLHGEVCSFFVTKLDTDNKKWLRPLVEARLKTMTLRPTAKGSCQTLLDLL